MANQDILFPLIPRNTQVDLKSTQGRIQRIEKRPRSPAVQDDEEFDDTQEARIEQRYRPQQVQPRTPPVADDPRKKSSDEDDDDYKGINLDTYA